jgi:hypothetical protein
MILLPSRLRAAVTAGAGHRSSRYMTLPCRCSGKAGFGFKIITQYEQGIVPASRAASAASAASAARNAPLNTAPEAGVTA